MNDTSYVYCVCSGVYGSTSLSESQEGLKLAMLKIIAERSFLQKTIYRSYFVHICTIIIGKNTYVGESRKNRQKYLRW